MHTRSSFPDRVLLRCCFPQLCPIVLRAHCKFPKHVPIVLRAQSSIAVFPQPCPIVLRAHFNFPQPCPIFLRAHSSVVVLPRPCPTVLQEANLLSRCFAPQTKMCDLGSQCVMTETNCTSYPCMASPTCIREFRITALKTSQLVYCLILFCCSTCSVSAVPLLLVLLVRCTQRLQISRSFILLFLT